MAYSSIRNREKQWYKNYSITDVYLWGRVLTELLLKYFVIRIEIGPTRMFGDWWLGDLSSRIGILAQRYRSIEMRFHMRFKVINLGAEIKADMSRCARLLLWWYGRLNLRLHWYYQRLIRAGRLWLTVLTGAFHRWSVITFSWCVRLCWGRFK